MPSGVQSKLVKLWLLLLFAHRYPVEGIVIETKPEARQMVVAHKPIDHYMPAMTMPFNVGPEVDLEKLAPGTRVRFQLNVGKHVSRAQNLKFEQSDDIKAVQKSASAGVPMGVTIPDFALTDQFGRPVSLSNFRGKVVVVDFIYTRCPLPDVCPRLSANFAAVSKKLRDVEFLSITIDPQYDTPAVLAEYARRWGAGESWRFLTGSEQQIQFAAGLFGLVYWPEEGSITHTVATAVIARDGTLAAKIDGAKYRPDQLIALIETVK